MQDNHQRVALQLLAYAAQKDVPVTRLCQLAGIEFEALKQGQGPTLTSKQISDLWRNAVHLSGDELLGLHLGEALQVAALGIVGELVRSSRTVGEALTHAAVYIHLLTDLFTMEVRTTAGSFEVQLVPTSEQEQEDTFVVRQLRDVLLALVLHEVNGLVLAKIQPRQVRLPVSAAELPEYQRVLRCETITAAIDDISLVFEEHYWHEPILTANYELQRLLLEKAASLQTTFAEHQPIGDRISRYLLANANMGVPTLEDIAANFNTSVRNMQRKLREENLTYQQLADDVRKELALHYLHTSAHPLKEVSYMLGYNELSAFSRAFKRWTGHTPGGYQKRSALLS
ncbi:AraC family transcriptional regulator [Hymenobacter sp. YC55]|uniref:AraC family transcriptional regulator n=1 Tax=Hymenobacter sp. YC55 TaxID=3034019 RepID=UPI0023F66C39|nr:AraC family transcriptional regulator [Hymenobacter sp. YC55]MDF7812092.1 AraC family transcriptional regulator ligand-binding domain-containing protein [Hymenobacter sp. YC55]